jgi:hypothetical protein
MESQTEAPLTAFDQLFNLVRRILTGIYLVFWACLAVCGALTLSVLFMNRQVDAAAEAAQPVAWTDWQFFFVALALASIYASFRLSGILLKSERLWKGTGSLAELTAVLEADGSIKGDQGDSTDEVTARRESKTKQQKLYTRAVQHLLSKVVFAHLVLWSLVEIPMVLGLVDRFWHDDWRLYTWLTVLSVAGLILRRPTKAKLRELLMPLTSQLR